MSPRSDAGYPSDVRGALLDAAHEELLEHGVGGLSLRGIAARAGVSRMTPKWHFGDRAGLLTGLAIEGFRWLDDALRAAVDGVADPSARFTALGRAYLDFGLTRSALFELMFRSDELRRDDPALAVAQRASFGVLVSAAGAAGPSDGDGDGPGDVPLLAWACAHGLVTLVQGGSLQVLTGLPGRDDATALAHRLADAFTSLAAGGR